MPQITGPAASRTPRAAAFCEIQVKMSVIMKV
jgi:hypothetical protein